MGGMWVTMASVSTNNKGWASPGEGQCPSGHPSFPDLALASAQSPLSHPLRLGVCPGPLPPAHFRLISSPPARKQRPDQPSTSHQTIALGLPSHCAATRLTSPRACGYFLRPTPKWPKGTPVLFSLGPGVPPVPSLPHSCSALPTNVHFLVRILPHSGSLHRDSRHIE